MKSLGNDGGDNPELIVIIISRTQMDWKWERERKYDKQSFCPALFCRFIRNTLSVFVGGEGAFEVQLYSAINLTGENLMTIYFSLSRWSQLSL